MSCNEKSASVNSNVMYGKLQHHAQTALQQGHLVGGCTAPATAFQNSIPQFINYLQNWFKPSVNKMVPISSKQGRCISGNDWSCVLVNRWSANDFPFKWLTDWNKCTLLRLNPSHFLIWQEVASTGGNALIETWETDIVLLMCLKYELKVPIKHLTMFQYWLMLCWQDFCTFKF